MKLPRRSFLQMAAAAAALPAAARIAVGAGLSVTAAALDPGLWPRRGARHRRPADRPVAVRAAGAALCDRQPARRRQQYRHRGGRAFGRRWLYAALYHDRERHQHDALREAQFRFQSRYRAGRRHHPRAQSRDGQSIISGQDAAGIHRLCESQSGQIELWRRQRRHRAAVVRAVQDDGRARHRARALSQPGAGRDRSDRRSTASQFRRDADDHPAGQVRNPPRAGGDDGEPLGCIARRSRRRGVRARL